MTTPAVLTPADDRTDVRAALDDVGVAIIRGLGLDSAAAVVDVAELVGGQLVDDVGGFAPRRAIAAGVQSVTDWDPTQPMCMHHERSFVTAPPSVIAFAHLRPAAAGGETSVADAAAVLPDLDADLVSAVAAHGWRLHRTLGGPIGGGIADVFGTVDRDVVARRCAEDGYESAAWQPDGSLRLSRTRPGIIRHPRVDHLRLWFNQLAFLNEWTMDPDVLAYLLMEVGRDGLPFATEIGDGSPLDRAAVDGINAVYDAHAIVVDARPGDLVVIDNLRMAHSRAPYRGDREVLALLADPLLVEGEGVTDEHVAGQA